MELRAQDVDRLMEALAPSLAAELEKILAESRQRFEDEFEARMQTALRDAELATLHLAEVRLEEAVGQAREEMRVQLMDGFPEQLNLAMQRVREEMSAKADEAMKAAFANWAQERTTLQEQLSKWHAYADAQHQLSQCTSQTEIVNRLFKLCEPFAESFAFYVSKADGLALWKSGGSRVFPKLVSPDTIDPDLYFKPAVVRDKVVAAVCATRPCKTESLEFLVSCFERAIESFGMKLQSRAARPPLPKTASNAREMHRNV